MLTKLLAVLLCLIYLSAPSSAQVTNAATTNGSVVITTGNTFQTVLPALQPGDSPRRSLTIENNNASDSCWLYVGSGTPTKGTSMLLTSGGGYTRYYPYVPSDAIKATCASTSDTLYVDTQ